MIFSLVAMTGLEKCCITSAYRSGYVTQVSDPWPVGLLYFLIVLCSFVIPSSAMRLSFHDRWTEDQSQLDIDILEIMAIRFALKKGHTLHPTLLCHDIEQHHSNLVCQQTRRKPFSQPLYRSMENPPLVPETQCKLKLDLFTTCFNHKLPLYSQT